MTRRTVFTRKAKVQLGTIEDFVALKADPATAQAFVERIVIRCEAIGNGPRGGRPRPDLGHTLRSVPFERSATIVYRLQREKVVISGIFFGGQDLSRHYRGGRG